MQVPTGALKNPRKEELSEKEGLLDDNSENNRRPTKN